jgi:hypothetical protein
LTSYKSSGSLQNKFTEQAVEQVVKLKKKIGLLVFLLVNGCLNSLLDCLSFELGSIRLGGHTYFGI